jgi:phosphoribosylformylglycinamidine synthase subunit PurSL
LSEEVLASCRGVYRGGLAVHLALCSLAGGLGVEADLGEILPELPAHAALYSESPGRFVVSLAPAQRRRFEEIFQGLPCHLIGEVRPDQGFTLKHRGRPLLTATLEELQEAWIRPFGNLV